MSVVPREQPFLNEQGTNKPSMPWMFWFEDKNNAATTPPDTPLSPSKDVQTDADGLLTSVDNTGTVNNVMSTDPTFDNDITVTNDADIQNDLTVTNVITQAKNFTDGTVTTEGRVHRKPVLAQTSNATPITLDSFVMASGYTYLIEADIVSNSSSTSVSPNVYHLRARAFRSTTGYALLTELSNDYIEGDTTQDAELVRSGTAVILQVTGHASNTITWTGQIKYISVDKNVAVAPS